MDAKHTEALITIIMRSTGLNTALFWTGSVSWSKGKTASGNNNHGHLTLYVLVNWYNADAVAY